MLSEVCCILRICFKRMDQNNRLKSSKIPYFIIAFLIVGAMYAFFSRRETPNQTEATTIPSENFALLQYRDVSMEEFARMLDDAPLTMGNKNAPIRIVEFSDFQCPYCGKAFPIVREMLGKYSDKVLFVYRDFPLYGVNEFSFAASMAARCAADQKKFWEYHDKLFLNQDKISSANIDAFALQLGLTLPKFKICMDTEKYRQAVQNDIVLGTSMNVAGTPTFFINGIRLQGVVPKEVWEQIIENIAKESAS